MVSHCININSCKHKCLEQLLPAGNCTFRYPHVKIFKQHGRVKIELKEQSVQISPDKDDFMSLAGAFKVKTLFHDKIRDYIDYSDL